jgi:glycosyltransferase involved in cell wall biosynthesis
MRRLSIIISNYNYGSYVRDAIESALHLNWEEKEVIVVDDGSTDDSKEIILAFGNKITPLFLDHQGQLAANNKGFETSKGDIIIFLDSDDILDQNLMLKAWQVWDQSVSKVQVQIKIIDALGRPTGSYFPQFKSVPSSDEIKKWMISAGTYPTPPGSGNIYARSFLEKVFPLPENLDRATDTFVLSAAPFAGNIRTLPEPLVSYRSHGKNLGLKLTFNKASVYEYLKRALIRFKYQQDAAKQFGIMISDQAKDYSLEALPYRVASLRMDRLSTPWPRESRGKVFSDLMHALWIPQGFNLKNRISIIACCLIALYGPLDLALTILKFRLVSASRPKWMLTILRNFSIIK